MKCPSLASGEMTRAKPGLLENLAKLRSFLLATCFWLMALLLSTAQTHTTNTAPHRLVMAQGSVEVMTNGASQWIPAKAGLALQPGDHVRTGERSRAEIFLGTGMTVQKGELSEIVIPPTPAPVFKRGIFKVFSREPEPRSKFRLPNTTTAAIRGTDFLVQVDPLGNSKITVIDGEVLLQNPEGEVLLSRNEVGVSEQGRPPTKSAVITSGNDLIQWNLYYPAVINMPDFGLSEEERRVLADSLNAYVSGDLVRAADVYPWARVSLSASESVYRASLLLSVGQVEQSQALLQLSAHPAARSLLRLIEAVKIVTNAPPLNSRTASEWMAESYLEQSKYRLEAAKTAAQAAVASAPEFGFAWARLAEMEFSFGHRAAAARAISKALALSPRNAQAITLNGFLLAADNHMAAARAQFDEAIAVDAALANAWLGRGLCAIHSGRSDEGLRDLTVAASLEPQRGVLRSYLGKAFANSGDLTHAKKELRLAGELDPRDPTPWLYSALLHQQEHRVNEGIADLERSQALNDNRQIYRSRQLLDQDQAVRSANLAQLYREAGMSDVSLREAASAVGHDYANYSAHLFLADSFDALRDPARFNLRYESVWFNELLLANLLAPVGAGRLSQGVSAQEYSRLFASDGVGIASDGSARSDGSFRERASQFGTFGRTSYALDLDYQHHDGVRPNNALNSVEWYTTVKQQITPTDTAMLLVKYEDYSSGDNFQYYDPNQARRSFSFQEHQDPIVVGAWNHRWSEGVHTLFLGGRLINEQRFKDRDVPQIILLQDALGSVVNRDSANMDVDYHNQLEIYTAELNQICDWNRLTISGGARYQTGDFTTTDLLSNPSPLPGLFNAPPANGSSRDAFERITGYGYLTLKPVEELRLIGGLTYEDETFPRNFRHPPITSGLTDGSQLGPKAGFIWRPLTEATLRGVFTRSLGGVSLDESYRLEQTQIAGFPQTFRTLIPESTLGVGSLSAPRHETFGLALDLKLSTRTYAGLQAERVASSVDRQVGVFTALNGNIPTTPDSIAEHLGFVEDNLSASLNQLLGGGWVAGGYYKFTQSKLDDNYPQIPASILTTANPAQCATLHQVTSYLLFNHPSGFFTRGELRWYGQHNRGYTPGQPGEDAIQESIYAGYRFRRGHGELRLGVLNLGGGNYRLNPLSAYEELPRKRVFEAQLRFIF